MKKRCIRKVGIKITSLNKRNPRLQYAYHKCCTELRSIVGSVQHISYTKDIKWRFFCPYEVEAGQNFRCTDMDSLFFSQYISLMSYFPCLEPPNISTYLLQDQNKKSGQRLLDEKCGFVMDSVVTELELAFHFSS